MKITELVSLLKQFDKDAEIVVKDANGKALNIVDVGWSPFQTNNVESYGLAIITEEIDENHILARL